MCGRFTLRAPASLIAEQFALFDLEPFAPRFNIAPGQSLAAVRLTPGDPPGRRQLAWLRWGLIPSWAEGPSVGNRLINARSETVLHKPAFRSAFRQRRCLVLADGFYEWQTVSGKGPKQPYFFRLRSNRAFAFAGLWESWRDAEGVTIESCTLLTTQANELLRPIHDRMPVILPPDAYARWLDFASDVATDLLPLLQPHPSAALTAIPVGAWINRPDHEGPQCIQPVQETQRRLPFQ